MLTDLEGGQPAIRSIPFLAGSWRLGYGGSWHWYDFMSSWMLEERRGTPLAKNAGGHRNGSVSNRSQIKGPNGNHIKRNTENGQFMDQETSGGPLRGVAHEPDGRREK